MTDHELDRIVCFSVGIPFAESTSGEWSPPVSTAPTFEQFEKIMAWLKSKIGKPEYETRMALESTLNDHAWRIIGKTPDCVDKRFPCAKTIARAVCLAVAEIVKERDAKNGNT